MRLLPNRILLIFGLIFIIFSLSNNTFGQSYDGPVGKTEIPKTYEGFQNDIAPQGELGVNGAPGGTPCDPSDPLVYCPIDSYLYVLLVLGVAYGYFKFGRKKVAVL